MRHQRLRVVATVEFPPGFKDDTGKVLSDCKSSVRDALRIWHDEKFGPLHWPVELHVVARWSLENEMEAVV